MIVVDASAITELLLQTELGTRVERHLYRDDDDVHAPHLLDVEVLSALRRLVRAGEVVAERAEDAARNGIDSPWPCADYLRVGPGL